MVEHLTYNESGDEMFDEMGNAGGRVEDVVVAKASKWIPRALLLSQLLVLAVVIWVSDTSIAGIAVVVGFVASALIIDARIRAMGLTVKSSGVHVVNFASSHVFDLDTVQIETEHVATGWPADDIPAAMKSGEAPKLGSLYLSNGADTRMKVGVAPSYGTRLESIVDDLKIAIARHRI